VLVKEREGQPIERRLYNHALAIIGTTKELEVDAGGFYVLCGLSDLVGVVW
jgi:hypothetical protein